MITGIQTQIINTKFVNPDFKSSVHIPFADTNPKTSIFYNTEESFISKFFKDIKYGIEKAIFDIRNETKMKIFNDKNLKKIGFMKFSFPKRKKMNIDYLEVSENTRKKPEECKTTIEEIIKYILSVGEKQSIDTITCLPMDENQRKLYQKFGFVEKHYFSMETSFKDFKAKADLILKSLHINPKHVQK